MPTPYTTYRLFPTFPESMSLPPILLTDCSPYSPSRCACPLYYLQTVSLFSESMSLPAILLIDCSLYSLSQWAYPLYYLQTVPLIPRVNVPTPCTTYRLFPLFPESRCLPPVLLTDCSPYSPSQGAYPLYYLQTVPLIPRVNVPTPCTTYRLFPLFPESTCLPPVLLTDCSPYSPSQRAYPLYYLQTVPLIPRVNVPTPCTTYRLFPLFPESTCLPPVLLTDCSPYSPSQRAYPLYYLQTVPLIPRVNVPTPCTTYRLFPLFPESTCLPPVLLIDCSPYPRVHVPSRYTNNAYTAVISWPHLEWPMLILCRF